MLLLGIRWQSSLATEERFLVNSHEAERVARALSKEEPMNSYHWIQINFPDEVDAVFESNPLQDGYTSAEDESDHSTSSALHETPGAALDRHSDSSSESSCFSPLNPSHPLTILEGGDNQPVQQYTASGALFAALETRKFQHLPFVMPIQRRLRIYDGDPVSIYYRFMRLEPPLTCRAVRGQRGQCLSGRSQTLPPYRLRLVARR